MGAVARYAYLNARVSVMAARLLGEAEIEQIVEQPAARGWGALEEMGLGSLVGEERIDLSMLEQAWLFNLLGDLMILVRCLKGEARGLLLYWIRRFELGNLKAIIRGKMAGMAPAEIRGELMDLGGFATVDSEELLRTEDVAELLRQLEQAPSYAYIARRARNVFEERHDLFMLDATLDRRYYTGLSRHLRAFRGHDRKQLDRLLGSVVDHINLMWLLRFRFAYGLPAAEAYYLLIPGGHRITGRSWQRLAQLGSQAEVIAGLPGNLSLLLEGAATISEVQRRLERETRAVADAILHRTAFNLARALAYLVLRELEMHQVLAVLKGRQLGLEPELVRFAAGFAALGVGETAGGATHV